ncbi:SIS domain-containing protein [Fundicoccus sp. Sow4_H7]|uniref:SIS domain-containing protein n=1 Tax=Fundicoccus sp. Sow4_H7 TaxID=3438784 RepID=UPI003F8F7288
MFEMDTAQLTELGAEITTREIKQQPELWQEVLDNYQAKAEEITTYLEKIQAKHEFVQVIFSGAGTSAFVGETISPYLNKIHDQKKIRFQAVATTDIVAAPDYIFQEDIPTILVSFARSGNSPESVATVNLAKQLVKDFYQITITCAAEGKLAKAAEGDAENLLLLQPSRSNDAGFAMTGSFTCMLLTALLVFDANTDKEKVVSDLIEMGQQMLADASFVQEIIDLDFNRVIYLGSAGFFGLAREAQLKILELTAGKIATMYETPLGFRHGPKSLIDENTLVINFVSSNPYSRQYDADLINEVYHDQIARQVVAISVDSIEGIDNKQYNFDAKYSHIEDVYLSLPFVIFAQTLSLLAAIKVGNNPDKPSPTGTVNRVVQGVILHEYKA